MRAMGILCFPFFLFAQLPLLLTISLYLRYTSRKFHSDDHHVTMYPSTEPLATDVSSALPHIGTQDPVVDLHKQAESTRSRNRIFARVRELVLEVV